MLQIIKAQNQSGKTQLSPGDQIAVDIKYTTDPAGSKTNGLTLLTHFNSNELRFDGIENLIAAQTIFPAEANIAATSDGGSNLDNGQTKSDETNSFFNITWGQGSGDWPVGEEPATLVTAKFTVLDDFDGTNINFTGVAAPNFEFNSESLTLDLELPNKKPVFDSDATKFNVAENSTNVTTVKASDGDGETLTYSISDGADKDLFSIDNKTGALSFKTAPDFENPTDADKNKKYQVKVAVSDGTDSVSKDLTVTVTDVNEKPAFGSNATEFNVTENKTSVTTIAATDPEKNTLTYSISDGADKDLFSINAQSGALRFKIAPDFENPTDADKNGKYQLKVAVSDGTNSVTKDLTVTVTDETAVTTPKNRIVYDAKSAGSNSITTTLSGNVLDLGTDAIFDNLVGFYEITGEDGGIDTDGDGVDDLLPGIDNGYAEAALANAISGWQIRAGSNGDIEKNTTVEQFGDVIIAGGKMYAPFVIANGGAVGIDGFIEAEASEDNVFNEAAVNVDDLVAYFAYQGANPDGASHIQARDNNAFGFEDLPANLDGISDNDFNDAVFKFDFSS
jgi:hypothetical protein